MITPPAEAIRRAELAAAKSPCAKSKRGVVTFTESATTFKRGIGTIKIVAVIGEGWNGPPDPLVCDASVGCRRDCRKRCVHAEMRALRSGTDWHRRIYAPIDLLHVKIGEDGKLVGSEGGPSCWQCSREILDSGIIARVWLYEYDPPDVREAWERWYRDEPQRDVGPASWCSYTAEEFHRITLLNTGVHGGSQ